MISQIVYSLDFPCQAQLGTLKMMPKHNLGMPAKKKNYVDRETVPKEGRGVAPFPYKNHS